MAKGAPSGDYAPQPINSDDPRELARSVEAELHRISAAFALGIMRSVEFVHAAPLKPREGMIRGADGVNWDPGDGKGLYIYMDGVWTLLFSSSGLGAIIHNSLSGLQGGISGERYHLSSAQHTDLTDGGDSALHFHQSDRDYADDLVDVRVLFSSFSQIGNG